MSTNVFLEELLDQILPESTSSHEDRKERLERSTKAYVDERCRETAIAHLIIHDGKVHGDTVRRLHEIFPTLSCTAILVKADNILAEEVKET